MWGEDAACGRLEGGEGCDGQHADRVQVCVRAVVYVRRLEKFEEREGTEPFWACKCCNVTCRRTTSAAVVRRCVFPYRL